VIKDIFYYISLYKDEYGIDNCIKLIHFLTQADHESNGFYFMKGIETFSDKEREKYKGREIFQLTHKDNYSNFQEHLMTKFNIQVDLVSNQEIVEQL